MAMTFASVITIVSACLAPVYVDAFPDSSSLIQNRVDVSRSEGESVALAPFRQFVPVPLKLHAMKETASPVRLVDTRDNNSDFLSLIMNAAGHVSTMDHLSGSFGTDGDPLRTEMYYPTDNEGHIMNAGVDVFPNKPKTHSATPADNGWKFFNCAPPLDWCILLIAIVFLILFDWFVLRRIPETFFCHIGIVFIWLVAAAIYNVIVYERMGSAAAFDWFTGYLLEWMLSMDNLFVFHLVFQAYSTPAKHIHKAVFIGIIGAVVMRMIFFMVVSTLLKLFGWFRWPFGALLIYSGIEAARSEDDEEDEDEVKDTRLIRALKFCLGSRLSEDYDHEGERCFIQGEDGRTKATLLLVVVVCLEITDVLFALDSVSAKVAQIPQQYIAFSSSVLAMFGLRAMFFIIKDLVEMFDLLKYGLCLILIFIGCELMFARWIKLSSGTVTIMIIGVFVVCILASRARQAIMQKRNNSDQNLKAAALEEEEEPAKSETKESDQKTKEPESEDEPIDAPTKK